jgi:hypothetical protein
MTPNKTKNYEFVKNDYISSQKKYKMVSNEMVYENGICYITNMYSFFLIYYPLPFLQILFFFVLFVLVFVLSLCKKQPLKSKGIFPVLTSAFYLLYSLQPLVTEFLTLEILSYFNCFLEYYIIHPLFVGISILIFIRTIRYLIHKWLHQNKRRLSNNKKKKYYRVLILLFKIISKWYNFYFIIQVYFFIVDGNIFYFLHLHSYCNVVNFYI